MSKQNSKSVNRVKIAVGYLSHMLATLIMMLGVSCFINQIILEKEWDETYFMYACGLFGIVALYSLIDCKRLYSFFRTEVILIFCFLVSALLLLLSDFYINVPLWLIGGFVAAALVNRNIGMLYVYYFVFHAIYLQGDALNGLIFHLVCATLVCIFIPKMKTWAAMLYMMIFTGALVIALSIAVNHFVLNKTILIDAFSILCAYCICIFVTMLFVSLLKSKVQMEEENVEEIPEIPVAATAAYDMTGITVREDFTEYCNEKSELLTEVKTQKKAAYAHAVLTGNLAYRASETIGLNATLAKAAALYEAVGKLHNDNAEEVAALLTERQVPDTLVVTVKDLIEGRITSKETALVSMADDVISNYTVIRHIKKVALSSERIVDKTLDKKMFQGEYNASGMTLAEYSGLRNAFVAFLQEQDKKVS